MRVLGGKAALTILRDWSREADLKGPREPVRKTGIARRSQPLRSFSSSSPPPVVPAIGDDDVLQSAIICKSASRRCLEPMPGMWLFRLRRACLIARIGRQQAGRVVAVNVQTACG
jgi:hypothetical protein